MRVIGKKPDSAEMGGADERSGIAILLNTTLAQKLTLDEGEWSALEDDFRTFLLTPRPIEALEHAQA